MTKNIPSELLARELVMEKMLTQLWKSFDVGTFKIMTFSTVIQPHTIYEELWKYVGENGRLGGEQIILSKGKYVFTTFSGVRGRNWLI